MEPPASLTVLFRDEHLFVVDKPSGLLVHRGWANDKITALSLARQLAGRWVHPAHRLDRGTSGVLIFALDSSVAAELQLQFAERRVSKRYLALVRGHAPVGKRIEHPLAKEKGKEPLSAVTQTRCLVRYELPTDEAYPRRYAWVEARPETGRAHQIRRHLKHIHHPIIGDVRYGKGEHNRYFRQHFQLQRMALHAQSIEFQHPVTGIALHLQAPIPAELQTLSHRLAELSSPNPPDFQSPFDAVSPAR